MLVSRARHFRGFVIPGSHRIVIAVIERVV